MISILEVDQPLAISFFHQVAQDLLPDATTLIFEQPPVAGLIRGINVMRHVFPPTTGVEDIENAIDHFTFVGARASKSFWFRQKPLDSLPLSVT